MASREEVLLSFLVVFEGVVVVDAVFDAEHARRPRADDGHEGFFVEVAEEVGSDNFHVLLV